MSSKSRTIQNEWRTTEEMDIFQFYEIVKSGPTRTAKSLVQNTWLNRPFFRYHRNSGFRYEPVSNWLAQSLLCADTVEKLGIFQSDRTICVLTILTNLTYGGDHINCDLFLECHCWTLVLINKWSLEYFVIHRKNIPFKLSSFSTVSAHKSHSRPSFASKAVTRKNWIEVLLLW